MILTTTRRYCRYGRPSGCSGDTALQECRVSAYTVRGARNGSLVHVTWTDGTLSGDPPTVDLVQVEAELACLHQEDRLSWARLVDPESRLPADPVADPAACWQLIRSVLDTVQSGEGDLPPEAVAALRRGGRSR